MGTAFHEVVLGIWRMGPASLGRCGESEGGVIKTIPPFACLGNVSAAGPTDSVPSKLDLNIFWFPGLEALIFRAKSRGPCGSFRELTRLPWS